MVFIKDLAKQFPWNSEAQESWEDKEIYTHHIDPEDKSDKWTVPIFEPMNGFAYTGFRIHVVNKDDHYSMNCRLVVTYRNRTMFGAKYDHYKAVNKQWTPLSFLLTHKMIAIDEDGLSLIVQHDEPVYGFVEFIGQQFQDILKDEASIAYAFFHENTIECILTQNNYMIKPDKQYGPMYYHPIKLLPSITQLLDKNKEVWEDTESYWNTLQYENPLEKV